MLVAGVGEDMFFDKTTESLRGWYYCDREGYLRYDGGFVSALTRWTVVSCSITMIMIDYGSDSVRRNRLDVGTGDRSNVDQRFYAQPEGTRTDRSGPSKRLRNVMCCDGDVSW